MRHLSFIIVLILLSSTSLAIADVRIIGNFGMTWPISEPDAAREIEQSLASINWQKKIAHLRTTRPGIVPVSANQHIPKAAKTTTRQIILESQLTVDFDFPDSPEVYPAGTIYRPLEFLSYNTFIVVIDGTDLDQLRWFQSSSTFRKTSTRLLITAGDALVLAKQLKRPVYHVTRNIIDSFGLTAVPSIISQQGATMEITEVEVPHVEP